MGTYRFLAKIIASYTVPQIKQRITWKATGGFDPIPLWKKVDTPVFFAFGGGDTNISVEESVSRLRPLNKENIKYEIYANGGHGIIQPLSGTTVVIQPRFLKDMVNFIRSNSI